MGHKRSTSEETSCCRNGLLEKISQNKKAEEKKSAEVRKIIKREITTISRIDEIRIILFKQVKWRNHKNMQKIIMDLEPPGTKKKKEEKRKRKKEETRGKNGKTKHKRQ